MYWPFKTTVKFIPDDAREPRVKYLELGEQQLCDQMRTSASLHQPGGIRLRNRKVAAATKQEA